jgi:hypothetical protein
MPVPSCMDGMDGKISLLLMITRDYSLTVVLCQTSINGWNLIGVATQFIASTNLLKEFGGVWIRLNELVDAINWVATPMQ